MLTAPTTPGELLDRITILELKRAARPGDPGVTALLDGLRAVAVGMDLRACVQDLDALRAINEALWEAEDRVRELLAAVSDDLAAVSDDLAAAAGPPVLEFARVAAAIPRLNDRRAALKRRLDAALRPGEPSEPKVYS
jgi:cob(I)alamin adenosyltransferase